jgi:phage baseplate assembly protein W
MSGEADRKKAFLGVGWSFPPCLGADGRANMAAYEEDIRQAILIILGTDRGERVMRPDFGAGLNSFVFEPVNRTTMQLVKSRVEESLIDWEARIDIQAVTVAADASERNKLTIEVTYRVRATNAVRNLVYPFYLQEGAGV